jgi:hypothetical protein
MTKKNDPTKGETQIERRILEGAEVLRKGLEPTKVPLEPLSPEALDQIANSFGLEARIPRSRRQRSRGAPEFTLGTSGDAHLISLCPCVRSNLWHTFPRFGQVRGAPGLVFGPMDTATSLTSWRRLPTRQLAATAPFPVSGPLLKSV